MNEVIQDDAIDAIHLPAPRYTIGEAHIMELKQAAEKAPAEITDRKTRQANHEAKMLCVKARTETEKRRQALKRESLDYGKRVDAAAKAIEGAIREIEQPLVARIEAWDEEQARLREIDEQRIAALRDKINGYREAPFVIFNAAQSANDVRNTLNAFLAEEVSGLEELTDEGAAVLLVAKDKARETANGLIAVFDAEEAKRKRMEEERLRVEEERKKLEEERREAERKEREFEAERQKMAEERQRMEEERQKMEADRRRMEVEQRRAENERIENERREQERKVEEEEARRRAPLKAFALDLANLVSRCRFDKSPEDIADMIGDLDDESARSDIIGEDLNAEADQLIADAQKEMLRIQHEKIAVREAEAERIANDKEARKIAAKAFLDAYAEAFDDVIGTDEDTVLHKIIAGNVAHCKWTGPAHVEPIEEEGEA